MRLVSVFVRDLLPEEGNRLKRLSRKAVSEVKRERALIVWAAGFALCGALYAIHYHSPPHTFAYQPTVYKELFFFFTFCANAFMFTAWPWATTCPLAGIFMVILLLAAAVYCFMAWRSGCNELCGRMRVWFAVAAFSVITGIMGALSRGGYGLDQAVTSRYVTLSIFLLVALINLVPMICDDLRARLPGEWTRRLYQAPALLAAIILTVQMMGYPTALDNIDKLRQGRLGGKGVLLLLNAVPDSQAVADEVHSNVPELIEEANALNQLGYLNPPLLAGSDASGVCQPEPSPPGVVLGTFEKFQPDVSKNQATASGWAVFPALRRPADEVFFTYQATEDHPVIFAVAEFVMSRDDVVNTFHMDSYKQSGWVGMLPLGPLTHHDLTLTVRAWALDTRTAKAYALAGKAMITPQ